MSGGWRQYQLGDLCEFKYGKMPKKTDRCDDGYPIFSGYNIVGYSKTYHYKEPEIIVVARGVGGTGDVKMSPPKCFLTNLSIAAKVVAPVVDKQFLYYRLAGPKLWELRTGSAQAQITIDILKRYELSLPPLSIQRKVASILSAYDHLIENNTRRIQVLEEMAQRIYTEWFLNFRFPGHEKVRMVDSELGQIPSGWEITLLSEIASMIKRGIAPKYDDDAECRVINQRCIRDFRLDLSPARRQSKKVMDERYVQVGDVLINSTGVGTLGRVAQVYEQIENCTVDTHVTIVRAGNGIDPTYWGNTLMSLQATFESLGAGTTGQTELSRKAIGDVQLVCSPKNLQKLFGDTVSPLRKYALLLQRKNSNLRHTRDILLPKLISGEIDVSDMSIKKELAA